MPPLSAYLGRLARHLGKRLVRRVWRARMTRDQELWACALEIERQHGEGAFLHASMRIDELDGVGDSEGVKVWRVILKRIEALETRSAQCQ